MTGFNHSLAAQTIHEPPKLIVNQSFSSLSYSLVLTRSIRVYFPISLRENYAAEEKVLVNKWLFTVNDWNFDP